MTSSDDREESERALQNRLMHCERVNKFLEELALLCREHGVYLEGHGEDTFLVRRLSGRASDPQYKVMWAQASTALEFPIEICWCPTDPEGLVDL